MTTIPVPQPVTLPDDVERTMILWEAQTDPMLECRRMMRHQCWLVLGPLYSLTTTQRFAVVHTITGAAHLASVASDPRVGFRYFTARADETTGDVATVYSACADAFYRWAHTLRLPIDDADDGPAHVGPDQ